MALVSGVSKHMTEAKSDNPSAIIFVILTPDTRLRGRSRFGAAKARHLKPVLLKEKIDKLNAYLINYL
jgi:hypothetical protein